MIAQDVLKKDAGKLLGMWDDDFRDNEYLRARMVCLIADVGALVQRHAAQMGNETGYDCPFQRDRFADLLCWQLVEYLSQSDFGIEARADNVAAYQVTERHAAPFFNWPPSPEGGA